ncbi:189L [Invertebrate iridescent virus 6]|uniref:189L n=1 Tax=Invertebrate iridescent virus 6 TaxID=176652 RepID=Q91FX7_IIV6|nr:189L [Invertebrate iridescent virus 6]AAK82055.1 189L [Invertebrate iridescent virus 6]QMS79565.1 hypothetical protein IIV6-T1_189 [Invertebrate iridescent virus 6]
MSLILLLTNLVISAVVFPPEVDALSSSSNPKPESDGSYPSSSFCNVLVMYFKAGIKFKYDLDKDTKDGLICLPTDSNDDQIVPLNLNHPRFPFKYSSSC